MTKETVVQYAIMVALIIFYLMYTIRYSIEFKKNILFAGWLKIFHLFMIWLVPIIWIMLLKSLTKSTPGSYEVSEKKNREPSTESDLGMWADSSPDN